MADREQQHIIRAIIRIGRKRRMPKRAILSALETGSVESRFRNLPGGDRDSQGWRQERSSIYRNPRNVRASINRYYDEWEADARGKGLSIGGQAQAVQQSAFPERYNQREGTARRLLRRYGGSSRTGASITSTTTKSIPGIDNSGLRRDLKLQYLAERDDPDALLNLGLGLRDAGDVPGRTVTTTTRQADGKVTGSGQPVMKVLRKAVAWEKAKVPYLWGGGHGRTAKPGEPVDCSGYVSAILGLKTPLVSGQFMSWGRPGKGKHITVYANNGHVLIAIRDPRTGKPRWFGTSRSNPGGGAGEIPPPSASYLSSFTARHPG